jgi:hypothetical protein
VRKIIEELHGANPKKSERRTESEEEGPMGVINRDTMGVINKDPMDAIKRDARKRAV